VTAKIVKAGERPPGAVTIDLGSATLG